MSIRDSVRKLRTSTEELDRNLRSQRRSELGCCPIQDAKDRELVTLVGAVQSVRIVTRAGGASIDVMIDDGDAQAVAVFYGRTSIAGVHSGRHIRVYGRCSRRGLNVTLINPEYELMD